MKLSKKLLYIGIVGFLCNGCESWKHAYRISTYKLKECTKTALPEDFEDMKNDAFVIKQVKGISDCSNVRMFSVAKEEWSAGINVVIALGDNGCSLKVSTYILTHYCDSKLEIYDKDLCERAKKGSDAAISAFEELWSKHQPTKMILPPQDSRLDETPNAWRKWCTKQN